MKISIIGSGNVATVLGRLLKNKDVIIEEIISRDKNHALKLAEELNAAATDNLSNINRISDVYIIAVKDDAVEIISKQLNLDNKIVVHTCGSIPINILSDASRNYGVLYPLQSLRKEINYLPVIPFLIDANNDYTRNTITKISSSISNNVITANDEQRLQYHLSAVIVSNFTNHLFALTKEYCEVNNINFPILLPLIEETVNRMYNYNPAEMQTGPAIRNDKSTIEKHIALLNDFPQLKKIYQTMTNSIIKSSK